MPAASPGTLTVGFVVGPTVTEPTEYTNSVLWLPRAPTADAPLVDTCSVAVIVRVAGSATPASARTMAAGFGGRQAWVQAWSAVGLPVSPEASTPWTLNVSESPSSPRLAALMVTLVWPAGTVTAGGWPMKAEPQAAPTTFQVAAAT